MILLLGATGYIGQAFADELRRRGRPLTTLSRAQVDYSRFEVLLHFLRETRPEFLINAAGYTGKPNVDACETARADTLQGNTLLPQTIAHACAAAGVPWGHVSSGCIYSGAKIGNRCQNGTQPKRGLAFAVAEEKGVITLTPIENMATVEKDLTRADLKKLIAEEPNVVHGFTETDEPNFSFRQPPCSFYSGTKALAEEALAGAGQTFIWRLRIPFDEFDGARNYLSKVQRYPKVYDNVNSISHRGDYARACLDLWERRAPFGTYNVTNPGWVTTRQVIEFIQRVLKPDRKFEFWESDEEFYRVAARTPRSNCVLDVSKLLATGVKVRPVEEALEDSLKYWRKEL